MENQTKFKLLIVVICMHLLALYFDLRLYWTNAEFEENESLVDLTELYCKRSTGNKVTNTCDSTRSLLVYLSENCGWPTINLTSIADQDVEQEKTDGNKEILQVSKISQQKSTLTRSHQSQEKPARQEKNVVYHILFVLLVTSVTASIVDFFQEKSRRKALENYNNSSTPTTGSRGDAPLNRRISLAELTMQRHARRESQAGYRPSGKARISRQNSVSGYGPP